MKGKFVKRGEIYWVDFSRSKQHGKRKERPVVILQNDIGNEMLDTTIVAPSTTTKRNVSPVIVRIDKNVCGLKEDSYVMLSDIFVLKQELLKDKIGEVTASIMREIDQAIKMSLGLEDIFSHPFYKFLI